MAWFMIHRTAHECLPPLRYFLVRHASPMNIPMQLRWHFPKLSCSPWASRRHSGVVWDIYLFAACDEAEYIISLYVTCAFHGFQRADRQHCLAGREATTSLYSRDYSTPSGPGRWPASGETACSVSGAAAFPVDARPLAVAPPAAKYRRRRDVHVSPKALASSILSRHNECDAAVIGG